MPLPVPTAAMLLAAATAAVLLGPSNASADSAASDDASSGAQSHAHAAVSVDLDATNLTEIVGPNLYGHDLEVITLPPPTGPPPRPARLPSLLVYDERTPHVPLFCSASKQRSTKHATRA